MDFLYNNFIVLILFLLGLLLILVWFFITYLKEVKVNPKEKKEIQFCKNNDENLIEGREIPKPKSEEKSVSDNLSQKELEMESEIAEKIPDENILPKDRSSFLSNYCQEKSKNNKIEKPLFIFGIIGVCFLVLGLTYYVMSFIADFIKVKGH